ncbi:DNA polymerase III subunit psi [Candidatus Hamiltonella defensa]|nr:DNA polymerase III subunit psi [Candidatus Hamiltonella defensa]
MMSNRDRLLQQLGITQWVLKHPSVFQGDMFLQLTENIRFIIVGDPLPAYDDDLIKDVLQALRLQPNQVYFLMPFQLKMFPKNTRCHSWRLGVRESLSLIGVQLYSPNWDDFYQNGKAKHALWKQICDHETDFYFNCGRSADGISN